MTAVIEEGRSMDGNGSKGRKKESTRERAEALAPNMIAFPNAKETRQRRKS